MLGPCGPFLGRVPESTQLDVAPGMTLVFSAQTLAQTAPRVQAKSVENLRRTRGVSQIQDDPAESLVVGDLDPRLRIDGRSAPDRSRVDLKSTPSRPQADLVPFPSRTPNQTRTILSRSVLPDIDLDIDPTLTPDNAEGIASRWGAAARCPRHLACVFASRPSSPSPHAMAAASG